MRIALKKTERLMTTPLPTPPPPPPLTTLPPPLSTMPLSAMKTLSRMEFLIVKVCNQFAFLFLTSSPRVDEAESVGYDFLQYALKWSNLMNR